MMGEEWTDRVPWHKKNQGHSRQDPKNKRLAASMRRPLAGGLGGWCGSCTLAFLCCCRGLHCCGICCCLCVCCRFRCCSAHRFCACRWQLYLATVARLACPGRPRSICGAVLCAGFNAAGRCLQLVAAAALQIRIITRFSGGCIRRCCGRRRLCQRLLPLYAPFQKRGEEAAHEDLQSRGKEQCP